MVIPKKALGLAAAITVLVTCVILVRNSKWMEIRHHRNELAWHIEHPHHLPKTQQQWQVHAEKLVELGYFFKEYYESPFELDHEPASLIWKKVHEERDPTVMSLLDRYSQLRSDEALIALPDDSGRMSPGRSMYLDIDVTPLLGDFIVYDLADRKADYDAVFKVAVVEADS